MSVVTLSGPIADEIAAERGEAAEDKSPALRHPAQPPKATSRSRSRRPVPTSLGPRAGSTFEVEDTEVPRRARGGTLTPPSFKPW